MRMRSLEVLNNHVNGRREFNEEGVRQKERSVCLESESRVNQRLEGGTNNFKHIKVANGFKGSKSFMSKLCLLFEGVL